MGRLQVGDSSGSARKGVDAARADRVKSGQKTRAKESIRNGDGSGSHGENAYQKSVRQGHATSPDMHDRLSPERGKPQHKKTLRDFKPVEKDFSDVREPGMVLTDAQVHELHPEHVTLHGMDQAARHWGPTKAAGNGLDHLMHFMLGTRPGYMTGDEDQSANPWHDTSAMDKAVGASVVAGPVIKSGVQSLRGFKEAEAVTPAASHAFHHSGVEEKSKGLAKSFREHTRGVQKELDKTPATADTAEQKAFREQTERLSKKSRPKPPSKGKAKGVKKAHPKQPKPNNVTSFADYKKKKLSES